MAVASHGVGGPGAILLFQELRDRDGALRAAVALEALRLPAEGER